MLLWWQEEQVGGSSANYDVELLHHADMHRDILRAGDVTITIIVCHFVCYTDH